MSNDDQPERKGSPPTYGAARAGPSRLILETAAPPPYVRSGTSSSYTSSEDAAPPVSPIVDAKNPILDSRGEMNDEGQIDVYFNLKDQILGMESISPVRDNDDEEIGLKDLDLAGSASQDVPALTGQQCPSLNIVIFIVGSRGDVQPYLSLALHLILVYSHRVRIATHGTFKDFVMGANARLRGKVGRRGEPLEGKLDFFDVGGDPKELMAYMVKNPGLLPGLPTLLKGEVGKKRKMTAEMLRGFYTSCFAPSPGGVQFAADAIISNPPAFAHVHVAEALGLPLLMTFTMPWTGTKMYKHPLVNVKESNADMGITNLLSYGLAEQLMWQGLGDVINRFRRKTLRLAEIPDRLGAATLDRLKIPYTYCWSEDLLPRPKDWRKNIGPSLGTLDVSGFYFLENDISSFRPDEQLVAFLEKGEPPMYIGFGSVVIPDPLKTTAVIVEAIRSTGVRAIIHAGWAGMGEGSEEDPNIMLLKGDVPHDWLFSDGRVAAVCHHGGAGTTAIGLREGVPTIVVPFFGDQRFWGEAIHHASAGPAPIPFKELTAEKLAAAIQYAVSPEAKEAAAILGTKIRSQKGEAKGAESFHRHMPIRDLRCDILPEEVAIWWDAERELRLSASAAGTLVAAGKLDFKKLVPHRSREYDVEQYDTGVFRSTTAGLSNLASIAVTGVSQLFVSPVRGFTNVFYGVPEAALSVVGDMYQGFANAPKRIGAPTRAAPQIRGFKDGLKEGGKELGFGLWDGIMGLFTEPIHGAVQGGFRGFMLGFPRSWMNMVVRPCAGSLGLFVLPTKGAARSIRRTFRPETISPLYSPRVAISKAAVSSLNKEQALEVIARWKALTDRKATKERRKRYAKKRNMWFLVYRKDADLTRAPPLLVERRASEGPPPVGDNAEVVVHQVPNDDVETMLRDMAAAEELEQQQQKQKRDDEDAASARTKRSDKKFKGKGKQKGDTAPPSPDESDQSADEYAAGPSSSSSFATGPALPPKDSPVATPDVSPKLTSRSRSWFRKGKGRATDIDTAAADTSAAEPDWEVVRQDRPRQLPSPPMSSASTMLNTAWSNGSNGGAYQHSSEQHYTHLLEASRTPSTPSATSYSATLVADNESLTARSTTRTVFSTAKERPLPALPAEAE